MRKADNIPHQTQANKRAKPTKSHDPSAPKTKVPPPRKPHRDEDQSDEEEVDDLLDLENEEDTEDKKASKKEELAITLTSKERLKLWARPPLPHMDPAIDGIGKKKSTLFPLFLISSPPYLSMAAQIHRCVLYYC